MNLNTITDRCGIYQESHVEGPLLAVRVPGLTKVTYPVSGAADQLEVILESGTGHIFILHHASAVEQLCIDGFSGEEGVRAFRLELEGSLYKEVMPESERILMGIGSDRMKLFLRDLMSVFLCAKEI